MLTLFLLAILSQAADASLSCQRLGTGRYHEVNPFLGQSCPRIIATKGAAVGATYIIPKKWQKFYLSGLTVGGGVGVTFTLALDK